MSPADLTALLRRHAGLIHKVAHAYCRDATDREDVVQEIAVQLWRARERYDPRFKETTWIYRIALNVAISWHRRERRHAARRAPLEAEVRAIRDGADGTPAAAAPEEAGPLLRCLDDLPPLDRALVLLWLDGNDHAAIGEVLGLSTSNVGTKLHRIKDRLRAAFVRARGAEDPHGQ